MSLSTPNTPQRTLAIITLLGLVCAIFLAGCQNYPHTREAAIDTYVRGMLAYQDGDEDGAMEDLKTAVNQHGNLILARVMLGDMYQDRQDYAQAIDQYQVVTQLDPSTGSNFYKLGLAQQLLNRVEDAIASYLHALKIDPQDFLSNLNLGACYLALNRPEDALPYTKKAVELNDRSAGALFNLGVVYDARQDYAASEAAYRRSVELTDNPDVAFHLAESLIHLQKLSEAHSVLDLLARNHPTALIRKRLGDTFLLQKQFEEALRQYTLAIEMNPQYCAAMNDAGWSLINQYTSGLGLDDSKRAKAVAIWKESLKINPHQPKIRELVDRYSQKFAE